MQVGSRDSKRTVNGTFRVSRETYDAIRREALENRTSVNTLLNQILWTHFFSEWPSLKPKQVAMSTLTFSEIMSRLPDDDAKRIGGLVAQRNWKSHMLPRYGAVTIDILAEFLRDFAQRGGYGSYYELQNHERIITIKHDLGFRGSIFIAAYEETLIKLAGFGARIDTTENEVILKVWVKGSPSTASARASDGPDKTKPPAVDSKGSVPGTRRGVSLPL